MTLPISRLLELLTAHGELSELIDSTPHGDERLSGMFTAERQLGFQITQAVHDAGYKDVINMPMKMELAIKRIVKAKAIALKQLADIAYEEGLIYGTDAVSDS